METKNMNKKGSITNIMFGILLVVAIFSGMYLFYVEMLADSGQEPDSKYSVMYENLTKRNQEITDKSDELRDTVSKIQETDISISSFVYGAKGVVQAILLLPTIIVIGFNTAGDLINPFSGSVPSWAVAILLAAITLLIIFAVLKALGRFGEL